MFFMIFIETCLCIIDSKEIEEDKDEYVLVRI